MKVHEKIIHEVNVAESINCNQQTRTRIERECDIAENEYTKKWNELEIWLRNNKDVSVSNVQGLMRILDRGEGVRDVRVWEGLLVRDERT